MGRNKMWEIHPEIWKTESAYMSWIRGGIRRYLWAKNPVKLEFIKQNRIRIPNPNPKGKVKEVWGGVCALTGGIHPIGDMEVDHIFGNHSLKSLDDLQSFIEGIVMVTFEDLQLVSKEAHKVKSHAEKQGISYEQAKIEKYVISLDKENKVVDRLGEIGVLSIPTVKAKRKALLLEILLKDLENKDV